jgi:hypothetical protein
MGYRGPLGTLEPIDNTNRSINFTPFFMVYGPVAVLPSEL